MTASNLFCTFCRRSAGEVEKLIAGPGVHICGDCVAVCTAVLKGKPAPGFAGWASLDDDRLLGALKRSESAVEDARAVLQEQIEVLRGRGLSWAAIGSALGISRQAAWERFG